MAFNDLLNPILGPLLSLPPLLAILIISLLISLFIVLIYKKLTDQDLMKRLKTEIKELQAEMKTLKNKPEKMMQVQKKAMETNTKYMMQSFKPTLFTMLPIILIFGWLNAHMAFLPIVQGEEFSVTIEFEDGSGFIDMQIPDGIESLNGLSQEILNNKAEWVLKGNTGKYSLFYNYDGTQFDHSLTITDGKREYAKPVLKEADLGLKDSKIAGLIISNEKIQPIKWLPIPWIRGFGWLGTYILFSIGFSILLRKMLKVY